MALTKYIKAVEGRYKASYLTEASCLVFLFERCEKYTADLGTWNKKVK